MSKKIIGVKNIGNLVVSVKKNKEIINKSLTKQFEKYDICLNNLYDQTNHLHMINNLYFDKEFNEKQVLISNLKKRLSSYKQQDVKKRRYNKDLFISFDRLIELLLVSKLRCHYCKTKCCIFYKNAREKSMWTLDRINNDIGHYGDNVVIGCLACNLQKRRRGDEAFRFTKQLIIKKNIF